MFQIQDISRQNIQAACWFEYKGYTISISTIFEPHDVAILLNGSFINPQLNTVEEAIIEVNSLKEIK